MDTLRWAYLAFWALILKALFDEFYTAYASIYGVAMEAFFTWRTVALSLSGLVYLLLTILPGLLFLMIMFRFIFATRNIQTYLQRRKKERQNNEKDKGKTARWTLLWHSFILVFQASLFYVLSRLATFFSSLDPLSKVNWSFNKIVQNNRAIGYFACLILILVVNAIWLISVIGFDKLRWKFWELWHKECRVYPQGRWILNNLLISIALFILLMFWWTTRGNNLILFAMLTLGYANSIIDFCSTATDYIEQESQ